ncbi:Dyp-type peroxidase, partial [Leucobacter sp. M11]|uniref:Dyp-type peroxidase n=1 Tax=Leucobacter sp. M11 TaxID=2993565 RepID=UPI002D7FCDC2
SLIRPVPGPSPTAPAAGDGPGAVHGAETIDCFGTHQAGITTAPTAHLRYLALDLAPGVDRDGLVRMLRIITGNVQHLTQGKPPLADSEPELAEVPARLTITVGFGRELVERARPGAAPAWLGPLPAFTLDQLDPAWGGGDLLLQIGSDDPLAIGHASRMLLRDLRSFATVRWEQNGFRRARGTEQPGTTMRNLMGQVDGTVNPDPEDPDFSGLVWLGTDAGWLAGGSAFVLRRIRMELDTWEEVDRPGREISVGRTLKNGAPLTGTREHDEPDYEAVDELGFAVIPNFAHIRRARSEDPAERIYRRAVNYDVNGEAGLLFGCFQRDPLRQFVPIQQRLDELDLLNEWITHTGSAVFAFPPGFREGGMIGETLFA